MLRWAATFSIGLALLAAPAAKLHALEMVKPLGPPAPTGPDEPLVSTAPVAAPQPAAKVPPPCALASAVPVPPDGPRIEFWPNRKKKVEAFFKSGLLTGTYVESDQDGKQQIRTAYKDGKLHGAYTAYYPDGQTRMSFAFLNGVCDGPFVLFDPEGRMQKQGTFRENLLEGPVTEYASDGKTVELLWQFSKGEAITLNGAPLIARPWDGVATEIRRLEGLQKFEGDPFQTPWSLKPLQAGALKPEYLQAALYHLEIYRLLAGLPYKALTLNEEYNREAQHGAVMLEIIDRLDHTPPQPPGMPDDFYQIAYTGTSHSNLAASGGPSMTCFKQVDLYMEDSDTRNLRTLGHRRWVMDPHAGQFGFGMGAHYGALRVMDGSSRETVEWDLLAWPPRGCLPVNYFGRDWAWSVSLNPARFTLPDKHETIEYGITPLDEHAQPSGPPLTLNASLVGKFANLDPTLILRPSNFDLTPN
ncbi:MAG TPA: hypothetical protein VL860_06875, partial [Planctomycetota bacterium]|nr:hypothetical protein [Planctomycetota bacterium]